MHRPTAALGAAISLALLLSACGQSAPPPPPAPQVTVATPVKRKIIDRDEYVGRFVAIDTVEIRARVSGYLDKVHFTDGQLVKAGDLLFTLDQRPFQAALDQARADLARAKSQADLANADLARAQTLIAQKTIAESLYDQRVQAKRAADAALQAAEAAVKTNELNLEFTELRAPVSGRIGDRRVSPGNLVTGTTTGGQTLLATVVSIDPIRFEFTFDEASYLRYQRIAKDAGKADERGTKLPVELRLLDEKAFEHKGSIDFVDNVIDATSGTIRGRAQFANPTALFTPGMFGRIRVPGSAEYEALLVPDTAIGTEQIRKFVYVVDGENTVRQKYLELGTLQGNLRVIRSGLEPGDRVIVNGLMRARAGAKVTPLTEEQMKAQQQQQQQKK
ncbi:MAG: efflux RND transporter periplasmic adaptor subunit [Xanthobacteraceae bacterium]|nr:efflux RND transporter periplasmic adaptor subunit [Xanthobacteraceae bacterium]MCW5675698.1 efflux RND transporter periplasmic adaptor subunit [Xanthobacteraceae bacterium]